MRRSRAAKPAGDLRMKYARVTQTANMLADLGAEAVGIANPVNPLLEPVQIAWILRAAGTRVLVTLGPAQGSDIFPLIRGREFAPCASATI